ncbi:putative ubiquitin carboxyl-terminal hydrolase 16 [Diplonema papillatum]|nr:putative ubiquitin carboxyl-terminal hydrolase 16 [Diplonema papillatum]
MVRLPPADADMRRRPEFAKPFLAPFFQTDCVRGKTEKTTQIDWPKWKEQGELFTARFQKRYRRLLDHTYATMRLQRPTDASNYRATGLIYGLVDAHANLLYIGKTSKTMQERVTKHWSGRNTKQDRFKRHLQNLPSPPYAFILYDVPEAFYAAGGNFDKVAEPIEMAFIARLKPQFNMVSTASGFNKRGKKPRSAPSFKGKPDSGQSTPEYPRERGDAWVHVKDGQIHVDQSRGRYFGIRKQLHYMFGLDEDTLRAYDVNPWMKSRVYRVRTWVRMFMVEHLQHPKVAILDELLTARLSEINHLAKKKKSAARTPWFCIRQVSKMMDERKLAAVFRHDTELREMLADSTDFVNTRVSTSLNPPLGVLLSNFTDVSRQTTAAPAPPPGECPCQRYLLDGYHIQGHACGQAHLLKTSSELISLFDKGRKFRPDGGEEAVCREVDKAVTQFVEEQFKDAPPHFARMLRRKILATVDLSRVGADPELTAGARKKLLELQEHLVILPVDKSSHDFGFVCKRFYNQDLHAKVNHSTNYSPSEETPQQVIARHKAYLGREGLHSSNVLPYLYGTLKLHKEVTSMRYIAGVSRKNCVDSDSEAADAGRDARPKTTFSSTTDAQLDLTGLLKAIMSILRREDDIRFNATGYRYFWITESSDDTAFFLKTHADELAQLDAGTFDFTTMYDQLELEELLNAVADTINEAFAAEAARLNVDAGRLVLVRPKSQHGPTRKKRCFAFKVNTEVRSHEAAYSAQELKTLLSFCLVNTYVLVNRVLMRQTLGIPMGANASPDIANLFCYAKERKYMMRLLEDGDTQRAALLSLTRRFIDDLLCFGTKPPPESVYNMRYKQTNAKVGDATFLGIRIRHEVSEMSGRRYMRLSVLDKAKAYRYQPLAYTSVLSTAPSNFGSSILIGALVRNGRIANNLHDFKTEMNNTVLKLMRRGYRKSVLKSGFRKWLLDTYPEAKFGDHCEKIRAHFVWLVHEVERILQMPDLESIDQAVERLLAEKAFVRYRDRPRPGTRTERDTPDRPSTAAPKQRRDLVPQDGTTKGKRKRRDDEAAQPGPKRRCDVSHAVPDMLESSPAVGRQAVICIQRPSRMFDPSPFEPAGLPNLGNTCFLNAVLQLLLRVEPIENMYYSLAQNPLNFRGFLKEFLTYFVLLVSSRSGRSQLSQDSRRIGAETILAMLPMFCDARQHDAHEALVAILDRTDSSLGPDETTEACPDWRLFQTCLENTMTTTTRCIACGATSTRHQLVRCLQVPRGRPVEDAFCVRGIMNPERRCDCGAAGSVVETMNVHVASECLLLQFGIYASDGARLRNDASLPLLLRLPDGTLRLSAVVVHTGQNTTSGHFVTYVLQGMQWTLFDDERVLHVDNVPWTDIYLAAYVRIPNASHEVVERLPSPTMMATTVPLQVPLIPSSPPCTDANLASCQPMPSDAALAAHDQPPEQPKDPPELRCKRCFTDRTKDGRLFRGLRGLHVHERLCTYVNFGE